MNESLCLIKKSVPIIQITPKYVGQCEEDNSREA